MNNKLLLLRSDPRVLLPKRGTPHSVGLDLHAFLWTESGRPNNALIPPKSSRAIPTGVVVKPPLGHAVFVCSRSGLAKQHSIFVTNSPGVVDPDYRGEIVVLLYNGGHESYYVQNEDRIAQLVVLGVSVPDVVEVESLEPTERGDQGFGSTGR